MSVDGQHVAVVGAGIGGLATAVLLARAGATVTLLERAPAITAVGAGILLQPNGLAVLGGLGLDEPLRAAGHRMDGATIRSAGGRTGTAIGVPAYGEGLDHMLAVRRGLLHEVLLDAVRGEPRIGCLLGVAATRADPDGTLTTASGERIEADLVVGCDGVRSAVRATGNFEARVRDTGYAYLRALVPADRPVPDGEYWTPIGLFGGAPVDAATHYFYASVAAPEVRAAVAGRDLDALRRAWAAVLPESAPAFDGVARFDDLLVNDVVRVDCARWHSGRRVLLGDAAHAMAPTAGQGANSALVDAAVLVAELTDGRPLPDALARYTDRRLPAVRRVQDRADQLTRLAHLRSPVARRVRDAALSVLGGRRSADRNSRVLQQEEPAALRSMVATLVPHRQA
jgi:2-polyprenyl-6-methoxyphenol hydroxylase-like FAD-dependent oxidoreductase